MKHIKRGYSWLFTRLAAIFGLTIGVQVATVTPSVAVGCDGYTTTANVINGKTFKYCEAKTFFRYCNASCQSVNHKRFYFYFMGCPSGYYSNYDINAKVTPSAGYGGLNSETCPGSCDNVLETVTTWGTENSALAEFDRLVECKPCPPFGTTSAQSDGGKVSTCYMSSAKSYSDDTGNFIWTSNCYFGD